MSQYLEQYNLVWETPSHNAGESMPCGGHDIGLNVWVEADATSGAGELLFYIDRAGSFDENNQMLKLGRVRICLTPNPFTAEQPFRQELKLRQGYVEITGSYGTRIVVWVEVERPVIHVEVTSDQPLAFTASYENWRQGVREIPQERRHPCASWVAYPGTVTTEPDTVDFVEQGVLFYHRNRNDRLLIDHLIAQQGLTAVAAEIPNPQRDRTFGGLMSGPGLVAGGTQTGHYGQTPHQSWQLHSAQAMAHHRLDIALHTDQSATLAEWRAALETLSTTTNDEVASARATAQAWWAQFWERSHICLQPQHPDPTDPVWQVGRNYQLFRYLLGCNRAGEYPTKFNGGLFIYDPGLVRADLADESADFRLWGGGSHTAQNQRLVYWPMLKSGDFDLMPPQFEYYRRALPAAEARTRVYWGHGGCSFTEQLENFGLPLGWSWGWPGTTDRYHTRPPHFDPTEQIAPWLRYYYHTQLEFALMILKYHQYSSLDIQPYLPFIESAIRFFDEHYQWQHTLNALRPLDANGHLVFYPSTALETYKDALNPADLIAALQGTVDALLEIAAAYLSDESRTYYAELRQRIPPLPFRTLQGHQTIAPAISWTEIINVELPQLYPVFPYEQYGLGKADRQVAIDTWRYGDYSEGQLSHVSWHQQAIFCARLGLTEDAARYTLLKLTDSGRRCPAFWGPGHDWVPDHNWGGSGMIGLQEMLMQCPGRQILLLPAWPTDWDVTFKLHAPYATIVEGRYQAGQLEYQVTPPERAADVVLGEIR
ncbi:MAG: hypothetical protein KF832_14660 [Caldilineaceae bacterium]|nr:hypothetical protein [Caldilineaceae bacterium]